jgi:hypothetical protein
MQRKIKEFNDGFKLDIIDLPGSPDGVIPLDPLE